MSNVTRDQIMHAVFTDVYYVVVPKSATYTKHMIEDIGIPMSRDVNGELSTMDESPTTVGLCIYDIAKLTMDGHSVNIHDVKNAKKVILIIYYAISSLWKYFDTQMELNDVDPRDIGNTRQLLENLSDSIYSLHSHDIDAEINKHAVSDKETLPEFGASNGNSRVRNRSISVSHC